MKSLLTRSLLLLALLLPAACVTEDVPDNTRQGNFDALWKTLDEHYCFFKEKEEAYDVNWDSVYVKYSRQIRPSMTNLSLFDLCADMLAELRDGHVNLTAAHNIARYWKWFEDYPANRSDSLERIYLGTDYNIASGLKYRILDDKIGYLRCASFDGGIGGGNLDEIMRYFSTCPALIIDLRGNGGGLISSAEKLASAFVSKKTLVGYMAHKNGKGHNDISTPEAIHISPFEGTKWLKPVAILTNRECYSAANNFVMFLHNLDGIYVVGDRTGGGSGMPFTSEIPNGWSVRFSACPIYDTDLSSTEEGIDPDIKADITSDDYNNGIDTIIETARALLHRLTDTEPQPADSTAYKPAPKP